MTNWDVHVFRTRDGRFRARVELEGERKYTRDWWTLRELFADVSAIVTLHAINEATDTAERAIRKCQQPK